MRRALGVVLLLLPLLILGTPSYGGVTELPSSDATWIDTFNYYRLSSGLSPIAEDKRLSAAVKAHVTYLTMSDPKYLTGRYVSRHLENPASPYYTVRGSSAGQEMTSTLTDNQYLSIDQWMAAPFHAIGLMREGLSAAGWATAYNTRTGFYDTGADVLDRLNPTRTKVIMFPGNGSQSRMDSFVGESPDPRESCGPHWRSYSGLPIWVTLLSKPPRQMSAQLVTPSGEVLSSRDQLCIVNEFTMKSSDPVYGAAGMAIIKADHMVLILPKKRLAPGLQQVSLKLDRKPRISWAFTVIARPQQISMTTASTPGELTWSAPPTQAGNPTLGYDVLVGDSSLKKIQIYRTDTTSFSTASLNPGNYWVCVKAIARYRNGDCPNFLSYTVVPTPN